MHDHHRRHAGRCSRDGLLGVIALGLGMIAIEPALAGATDIAAPIQQNGPSAERAPPLRLAQGHSQTLPRSEQDTPAAETPDDGASRAVRVADLIGLPIVDQSGVALGYVSAVATAADEKFQLLMPLGGLFGFGARLVPIPFDSVVMAGAKITVVDLPADRFQKSPTWYGSNSQELAADRTVRIGVPKS
jgi:sporulation protein YlmC with PRC-barrel domain